jgi:hypothetical protein
MNCPRCQHDNLPEAKFCEACAALLERICSNCAAPLRDTAKFCPACAYPVAPSAAALRRFASPVVHAQASSRAHPGRPHGTARQSWHHADYRGHVRSGRGTGDRRPTRAYADQGLERTGGGSRAGRRRSYTHEVSRGSPTGTDQVRGSFGGADADARWLRAGTSWTRRACCARRSSSSNLIRESRSRS